MFGIEDRSKQFLTACEGGGSCVEVADYYGYVLMRDSKNSEGPRLVFSRNEWTAFLVGAKRGDFDQI
ncbi:DUF397 domain-containing protein [Actinomadura madurae]|uniref:DUF397 domain-containing protein n=1 Tax=Actinomadura madurae TaxID=1993 RepID=UPI003999E3ED